MKVCPYCEGMGLLKVECNMCGGTGKIKCEHKNKDFSALISSLFKNCEKCGGSGVRTCGTCEGIGKRTVTFIVFGGRSGEELPCSVCGGQGRIPLSVPGPDEAEKCRYCGGKGYHMREKQSFADKPNWHKVPKLCRCFGVGYLKKVTKRCNLCSGSGTITKEGKRIPATPERDTYIEQIKVQCSQCNGTERYSSLVCVVEDVPEKIRKRELWH